VGFHIGEMLLESKDWLQMLPKILSIWLEPRNTPVLIHMVDIPIFHADEDVPRGTGKWEADL
jgi:hypothetical protein